MPSSGVLVSMGTQIYVLSDRRYGNLAAVSDGESAEAWLTYDKDFSYVELELDDYRIPNEAQELSEEYDEAYEDAAHLQAAIANTEELAQQ